MNFLTATPWSVFLFTSSLSLSSFASIPTDMHAQIVKDVTTAKNIFTKYSDEQINIIKEAYKKILERKFKESIMHTPSYKTSDIDEAFADVIKPYRKSLSDREPSDVIKEAMNDGAIRALLNAYENEIIGDVIVIKYGNYSIPLTMTREPYADSFQLNVVGLPGTCLTLKVSSRQKVVSIEWLGVLETACPLDNKGSAVLTLAEDLAKSMKMSMITLQDASSIWCEAGTEKTAFFPLRLMQTGKGWYESKGYFHVVPAERETYDDEVKQFLAYQLKNLFAELNDHRLISEVKKQRPQTYWNDVIRDAKEEIKAYLSDKPEALFREFMIEVFVKDCALYNSFSHLFLNDENKVFTIEKLMPYQEDLLTKKIL